VGLGCPSQEGLNKHKEHSQAYDVTPLLSPIFPHVSLARVA